MLVWGTIDQLSQVRFGISESIGTAHTRLLIKKHLEQLRPDQDIDVQASDQQYPKHPPQLPEESGPTNYRPFQSRPRDEPPPPSGPSMPAWVELASLDPAFKRPVIARFHGQFSVRVANEARP
jgi:hypothetical protein